MPQLPTNSLAGRNPPTQVALLEWVCGGGLLDTPLDQISHSLMREGQAMLLTIVDGLTAGSAKCGIEVIVPIDTRLLSQQTLARIASVAQIVDVSQQRPGGCLETWAALAKGCQWSWLIAPELDSRLMQVAQRLRAAGLALFNCDEEFLRNASDKSRTEQLLRSAGIPHPPTRCLSSIDAKWLDQATQCVTAQQADLRSNAMRWVIKPADGAGCEGLQIVDRSELMRIKHELAGGDDLIATRCAAASLVVQPMLTGIAGSCSAVVDRSGQAHWLPLVSQDLVAVDWRPNGLPASLSTSATLRYLGCTYPAPGIPSAAPPGLLSNTIRAMQGIALGWVGIDLLFDPGHEQWWVIEVNPRCTSSLVGLAAAYHGNLIGDIFGLQTGSTRALAGGFSPLKFRVADDTS